MIGKICFTFAVLGGLIYAAIETPFVAGTALWAIYMLLSVCCITTVITSRNHPQAKYERKVIYSQASQS